MLSQFSHTLVWIADSIMVGQTGTAPLAAASVASGVVAVALVLGLGISMGITPPVAAADGRKDYSAMPVLVRNGLAMSILTGLLLSLILYLASPYFYLLQQPEAVTKLAIPYFGLLAWSLFPLMIFSFFKQLAEGLSDTKGAMFIALSANLLNIGLNYLFIFGKGGFQEMGVYGAGLATLIARIVMAMAMAVYVLRKKRFKPYLTNTWQLRLQATELIRLTKLGFPIGLQMVFEAGVFSMAAVMVGWIGTPELAAHQVVISSAAATFMIATGLSGASTVRVGNFVGTHDMENVYKAAYTSFMMVIVFMLLTAAFFLIFRYNIARLYNKDPGGSANSCYLVSYRRWISDFRWSSGTLGRRTSWFRRCQDSDVVGLCELLGHWYWQLLYNGLYTRLGCYGCVGRAGSRAGSRFVVFMAQISICI